mgnify:CR=1 FL=1
MPPKHGQDRRREVVIDVVQVGFDRAHGQDQFAGDLPVGQAGSHQAQHLQLALADAQHLLEVQVPGLADDSDDLGLRVEQGLERFILFHESFGIEHHILNVFYNEILSMYKMS